MVEYRALTLEIANRLNTVYYNNRVESADLMATRRGVLLAGKSILHAETERNRIHKRD